MNDDGVTTKVARMPFLKFLVIITKVYIYLFCWCILWQLLIYAFSSAILHKNAIKCFLAIFLGLAQFFAYFDPKLQEDLSQSLLCLLEES